MPNTVTALHPRKWQPDECLVDAALAGRLTVTELDPADKAWLVARLSHRGETADRIAEALHCTRRYIQQIRCEPMAVVVRELLEAQTAVRRAETRMKSASSASSISQLVHELDSLKESRGKLIDQLAELRRRYDTKPCPPCPPQVTVIHPPRRRRSRTPDLTIPLF